MACFPFQNPVQAEIREISSGILQNWGDWIKSFQIFSCMPGIYKCEEKSSDTTELQRRKK